MISAAAGTCHHTFVGRERECRLLDGLVDASTTGGSAVVVVGEAGVGKTALLGRVAATASTAQVRWIHGVESEVVLPFAAAADLLLPLGAHFDRLPDVQREALEICLALRPGAAGSPLAACAATLGVLASAGEQQPLLVLVDDFQWVDPPSQQILLFVARRLATERVVIVFAVREQPGIDRVPLNLPTLVLAGLSVAESRALAVELRIDVSAEVLGRLVEQTAGNPLAIVETLSTVPRDTLLGAGLDFGGPSVGPTLQRAWSEVIDGLPEATGVALFVLAASRSADPADIGLVLDTLGCSMTDLAPAERCGLVRALPQQISLRHPLLRPVIISRIPVTEQPRMYRALADNARGHLRAWYLAASTVAPDDAVADMLDVAALQARERSGYPTSARTWGRAADLTVDPGRRAERLLAAATDAQLAGESRLAVEWCKKALTCRSDPVFAADVEIVRARSHVWLGHPQRAIDDLVRAGDAVRATDRRRAAQMYAEATLPCAMTGRVDDMLEIAARSAAAGDGEQTLHTAATTAVAFVIGGRSAEGRRLLAVAGALNGGDHRLWDLQYITFVGQAHLLLEDFDRARPLLSGVLDAARSTGSPAVLAMTLSVCLEMGWWTGNWAAAYADGTEALQWAEELHQAGSVAYALMGLGRIDAARGDAAVCRLRMDRAVREIGALGIDCMQVYVPAVLGLNSLGARCPEEAVEHLDRAWYAARAGGLGCPTVVPFAGDLVEARIRVGDRAGAEEALVWVEERAAATGLAYPAAVAARCRGLLATDLTVAQRHFAEARAVHEQRPMPFELARTLLCEGESMRRLRRPAMARRALHDAMAVFDRLGARPWSARVATELEAAGAPGPRQERELAGIDMLTPQEYQTARIVAEGMNNIEAAAALFVSRKTVEAHLSRVYRKLGLRSRAELARMFGEGRATAPTHRDR